MILKNIRGDMKIPFSTDAFFEVFEKYNLSVWPAQWALLVLAVVAMVSILRKWNHSARMIFSALAVFWAWMGLVYHIAFFASINKIAYGFGLIFVLQSILFAYFAIAEPKFQFRLTVNWEGILGSVLLIYALIIYPWIGYLNGHVFPATPTFGVPCPTTIFTLGLLLLSSSRLPWYLFAIPILWSVVGLSAAVNLSVPQDFGLGLAGALSMSVLLARRRSKPVASVTSHA